MKRTIGKAVLLMGMFILVWISPMIAKAEMNYDIIEKVQAKQEKTLKKIGKKNREKVNHALESCKENGAEAAKHLNKIKGNRDDFEAGVREVLNEYYSMEKQQREELESFEEALDESAETIVEHYEEAAIERENSENLAYQTEEVMVTFPHGTSQEVIEQVVGEAAVDYEVIDSGEVHINEELPEYKKKRLEKIKDFKTDVVILAEISLEDTVARAEKKFESYDCVKDASENSFLEADGTVETSSGKVTSNDPYFNTNIQWNMENIDIPRAWKKFKSVSCVMEVWVAVIDCGVQMNHPDLKGALLKNYSVDVTQNNKKLIDCPDSRAKTGQYTSSHGTMVAGIIAAQGNNGKLGAGVASIASEEFRGLACKIMAIKCDRTLNSDRHVSKAYLSEAIIYAVENGADVINISYSSLKSDYKTTEFNAVQNAINKAIKADVCVVASAGNDKSKDKRYPAAFDGVIGVGATLPNNEMTSYSNQSPAVDIVAPGGGRWSQKNFFYKTYNVGCQWLWRGQRNLLCYTTSSRNGGNDEKHKL